MRITYGRINLKQPSSFDTEGRKILDFEILWPSLIRSDVDAGDDGEGERVDEEEEALEAGGHQDPVLHDARLLRVGEAAFRGGRICHLVKREFIFGAQNVRR